MVHIAEDFTDERMYDSPIFSEYFSGMKIVAADIETTGLSAERGAVILGGVAVGGGLATGESDAPTGCGASACGNDAAACGKIAGDGSGVAVGGNGGIRVVQFFADSAGDEAELLERYARLLSQADVVVTYNGQSFDLPFLKKRMARAGLDTPGLNALYSFDLLKVLRKHSHLPKILPDLRQKTVEMFLGDSQKRRDKIDGAQSAALYYEYTRVRGERRNALKEQILLHNHDDLLRLCGLMKILRTLDLHAIMNTEGFPVAAGGMTFHTSQPKFKRNALIVSGRAVKRRCPYRLYEDLYEFEMSGKTGEFHLTVFCEKVQDSVVADVAALGVDNAAVRKTGGYESGFLILKEGKSVLYREVNLLIRAMIQKLFSAADAA